MRVEMLCTGDELLNGTVSDTNTADLATRLQAVGVELGRSTAVGDALEDIAAALREASGRADVVVLSGGLGPTEDDRTVDAVCQVAGVDRVLDEEALRRLTERLRRFGREVSANNRRQAMVPRGARVLQSDVGTAPGLCLRVGGAEVWVVPGVPREAQWFADTHLVPALQARSGLNWRKVTLRCAGIGESDVDRAVEGLGARHPGVTVHFRTTFPENHLYVVARDADAARAQALADAAATDAQGRLGGHVFSTDGRSLPAVLRDALLARAQTVSAAESCTGGWVQKLLTDEPGSSRTFLGGVVAYDNRVKMNLLGVPQQVLAEHGAVSAPTAEAMALGVRRALGTTWGLSTTGVAGPDGGTEHKPVGLVFVGLAGPHGVLHQKLSLPWDRERTRHAAAHHVLRWLWQTLEAADGGSGAR